MRVGQRGETRDARSASAEVNETQADIVARASDQWRRRRRDRQDGRASKSAEAQTELVFDGRSFSGEPCTYTIYRAFSQKKLRTCRTRRKRQTSVANKELLNFSSD